MNDAQKKVLRQHHGDILKNLVIDQDVLGFLLHRDILTESLVQTIQVTVTKDLDHGCFNIMVKIILRNTLKSAIKFFLKFSI